MTHLNDQMSQMQRRAFLANSGVGLGSLALGTMLAKDAYAAQGLPTALATPGVSGLPHHAPKVKRVIFLCMAGGPSHLETFDYRPRLAEMDGEPMPESITAGQPIAQLQGQELLCQGPMTRFTKYGQAGQVISDYLPWHGRMADDLCIIRSMVTEQIN
ncbi:unnamed protein product, partial [marine sediment metagenome]